MLYLLRYLDLTLEEARYRTFTANRRHRILLIYIQTVLLSMGFYELTT